MHAEAFTFIRHAVQELPPRQRVVELGGRDFNGSVRSLFGTAEYTSVDILAGYGVDVVSDAATYEPAEAPDTVVCCEVLEHASNAEAIVHNAIRMLQPGGALLLTCACDPREPHSAIDGMHVRSGEWYRNVPPAEFQSWLAGVNLQFLGVLPRGDLQCLAVKP